MAFILDERLQSSARHVIDLSLCWVALKNDKTYPWLYLVPRREGIREIHDLPENEQEQLIREMTHAGRVLQRLFHPAKINTAALGNMVPQLHVHVFARFTDDPAWPRPVWAVQSDEIPYTEEEYDRLVARFQQAFAGEDA